MKKLLLAGVSLAALLAEPAMAADLAAPVYRRPVVVAAPWTWSGFYLGIQGGAGWGASDWNAVASDAEGTLFGVPRGAPLPLGSASMPLNGWHGGGTIGYNQQFGQTVIGIEGDISGANIDGRSDCSAATGVPFALTLLNLLPNSATGTSSCHT
jgi:outer membrane immunogenic protein